MYSLEREFVDLRARRVALRKAIERGRHLMGCGMLDRYDAADQLQRLAWQLRDTEKRWAELTMLTGRSRVIKPVRLATPAPARAAASRAAGPMLNRMLRG